MYLPQLQVLEHNAAGSLWEMVTLYDMIGYLVRPTGSSVNAEEVENVWTTAHNEWLVNRWRIDTDCCFLS